jgi:hypothetical protein
VKYADGLVIQAKEETMLQGMIAKLSENGSCFEMEMNVEKLRTISVQTSPIQTMTDQKEPANVEYFNYWGSTKTNDTR